MTPDQIVLAARRKYLAVGDSTWADEELRFLIYEASQEFAREAVPIETIYTTTSVADTAQYSKPTNAISIKRIEYNGVKLTPVTQRESDSLSLTNSTTAVTGTPSYYYEFSDSFFLVPTPDTAGLEIKIFTEDTAQEVGATSVIQTPTQFHMGIVHYLVSEMFAKDQNASLASYHLNKWNKVVQDGKKWNRRRKRGDAPAHVQDEDTLPINVTGIR